MIYGMDIPTKTEFESETQRRNQCSYFFHFTIPAVFNTFIAEDILHRVLQSFGAPVSLDAVTAPADQP